MPSECSGWRPGAPRHLVWYQIAVFRQLNPILTMLLYRLEQEFGHLAYGWTPKSGYLHLELNLGLPLPLLSEIFPVPFNTKQVSDTLRKCPILFCIVWNLVVEFSNTEILMH